MTTPKHATQAATATKKTKTKKPAVIDRPGVDLGSNEDASDAPAPAPATPTPAPDVQAAPTPLVPVIPAPAPAAADPAAALETLATPTPAPLTPAVPTPAPAAQPIPTVMALANVPTAVPTTTSPSTAITPAPASSGDLDPSAIPIMNAPPTVSVPAPPAGFVPVPGIDLRGFRPTQAELACVPDAVLELGQIPNWGLIFGITAPAASQVEQRLQVASQWTGLRAGADSWSAYVNSQEGMAWKDALEVMNDLKPAFALATAASPAMLSQYPALARLLGAQKVIAKRGAATKKKNLKATTTAGSTTAATATAVTPATAAIPPASATPARVVTVQG